MNFELAEKLDDLVVADKLDEAIKLAESELLNEPRTDFHKIIGLNLLHQKDELVKFIDDFYKKTKSEIDIGAIYCEMNGFTINYDLWYIDLFAYEELGEMDDLDWLADFEYSTDERLAITGFEELQSVYEDYMENEKWKDEKLSKSADICELLVILRLQELFREAKKISVIKNLEWKDIPILATAHDYDLIYKS